MLTCLIVCYSVFQSSENIYEQILMKFCRLLVVQTVRISFIRRSQYNEKNKFFHFRPQFLYLFSLVHFIGMTVFYDYLPDQITALL